MITPEQVQKIFEKIKPPTREYLNFDEFCTCIKKLFPTMTDELKIILFRIIDANDNEQMEIDEFQRFFRVLNGAPYSDDYALFFTLADLNDNGEIDISEAFRICDILGYRVSDAEMKDMMRFYGNKNQLKKAQFSQFMIQMKESCK
ncbi:EF-hand_calcium-binding domain-containing protein [Hexamita inflata]|uniref:EF-hand calcium-binding domain-containing protein n=1 Tax=Hexamita inflata TaxID=28002 RepID=A0AA86R6B9_9EUKA|nr:EF-hand calcium-binding domain-containing protein [Hexamita inflata]CAI9932693.1 EF-hand calcium-binding domain-containing protein [Hexamita inflata]CAI9939642.1 EF-hand calcium-binding domain-containing protein [Hexamita inflata]CAI9972271.1 EF-hand calcium-binding domain-containing protein [Hexamita inflata]